MNKLVKVRGNNIYPFSRENFDALINFYFIRNGITRIGSRRESSEAEVLNYLYEETKQIELYEFEFILNCIIENLNIFKSNIGNYLPIDKREVLSIENLCKYGLDCYFDKPSNGFSSARIDVTVLFMNALIKSANETI